MNNFDRHIVERKEKRRSEAGNLQDLEDELAGVRKSHMEAVNEHGSLKAEEKVVQCFAFPDNTKLTTSRHNRVGPRNAKPLSVLLGQNTI